MGCKSLFSSFLLAAVLSVPLWPQTQTETNPNLLFRPAVPNPAPWFKYTVDTTGLPVLTDHPLFDYPNGQVHDFGGILQPFANFVNHGIIDGARLPFGAHVAVPLAKDRVELAGDTGGVYAPFQSRFAPHDSWLTQVGIGARVALDPERRVWVGVHEYLLTNFANETRHWSYRSADLTFRWGR